MNVKLGGSMRYRDMGPFSAVREAVSGGPLEPTLGYFHCKQGHLVAGANLYLHETNGPMCRLCKREREKRASAVKRERRKAAA